MSRTLTQVSSPNAPQSVNRLEQRWFKPRRRQFRTGRDTIGVKARPALPDLGIGISQCVTIKADADNLGNVYVGRVGVTGKTGFKLRAGEEIELTVDNLNSIYVVASQAKQVYCWIIN